MWETSRSFQNEGLCLSILAKPYENFDCEGVFSGVASHTSASSCKMFTGALQIAVIERLLRPGHRIFVLHCNESRVGRFKLLQFSQRPPSREPGANRPISERPDH